MAGLLEGKCGLVVGGSSGIGRASAIRYAEEGAKVMVAGTKEDRLKETVKMITDKGGVADYVVCDIRYEDRVEAMVDKTVKTFGRLDFAHNNAARDQPFVPIWERDAETFKDVVLVNLIGNFYCLKHEAAVMVKQGKGSIVFTSSGAGSTGCPSQEPYSAAKAGVNNMVQSAACSLGSHGVRVNAILPGVTLTPMVEELFKNVPEVGAAMLDQIPIGRAAEPVEQANACLFMLSDLASDVNGTLLKVDGGYLAGHYHK